jgi:hypothetical protein
MWFGVWGGIGQRQSRQADELQMLGLELHNDTSYYAADEPFCYDVPQEPTAEEIEAGFNNYLKGVTPVCNLNTNNWDAAAFNVLYSFSFPDDLDNGYGPTLTVFFLFSVAVYFATSSDSGSLVVDFLASNGHMEHHWIQRMFWALTEGAVATALLNAGGANGLAALQAGSIVCGLPFTVMLLVVIQSIYEFCEQALDPHKDEFTFEGRAFKQPVYGGVLNIFEKIASFGNVHPDRVAKGMDQPTAQHWYEFFMGLFLPMVSVYRIMGKMHPKETSKKSNMLFVVVYSLMHITWIVLFCMVAAYPSLRAWGWGAYFVNACLVFSMKNHFTTSRNIASSTIGDFISSLFFWPQVFSQLIIELEDDNMEEEAEA